MRRAAKRVLDVTASAVALVMIAPVLAVVALMVRLDGPGILFRQERIGRDGHPFHLLKFRSMRPLREGETAAWAVDADRYGRFGKFLRRYSLDELPQLVNVLMGDMSLVGPRPERPEYVALFGAQIFSYRHRHRVTVGLTGLAAVEGLRGDSSIDERARFDNWYIENWSLWLDMKILARTVVAVLKGSGS
jgi:lipopolysaccharide/colanic/teichoic acid biosynthesis glycosyltransferase